MYPEIHHYILQCVESFHTISDERKNVLKRISEYVLKKDAEHKSASLIYICTHNSRRSHLGQIWSKVAAEYYGIKNINTYSAGTEVTAFNASAIKALQDVGFRISTARVTLNSRYEVKYSESTEPLYCFSKDYKELLVTVKEFCAVMTCTEADGNCPVIEGTELRISCPYDDPKLFDGTEFQEEKYAERCRQIATECLYVFSLLKK